LAATARRDVALADSLPE